MQKLLKKNKDFWKYQAVLLIYLKEMKSKFCIDGYQYWKGPQLEMKGTLG